VTADDVYSILPFDNTLVTVELTGAEIKQLLASQTTTPRTSSYGAQAQLQVSGIHYEWADNGFLPPEEQIKNAYVNGERLQDDETYTVTVNSFMAGWSDSVLEDAPRVSVTDELYGSVTAEYVEAQGTVAPEDVDRIRRVDVEMQSAPVLTNGEDTATAVVRRPAFAESVQKDSFYVLNETGARLDAESVAVTENRVFVRFDDAELRQFAENSEDLQVYGLYAGAYTGDLRTAFDYSVMNTDIEVVDRNGEDGSVDSPTASSIASASSHAIGPDSSTVLVA
jgi:hypothetical protein